MKHTYKIFEKKGNQYVSSKIQASSLSQAAKVMAKRKNATATKSYTVYVMKDTPTGNMVKKVRVTIKKLNQPIVVNIAGKEVKYHRDISHKVIETIPLENFLN